MKALWIRVDANKAAAEEICAIADVLDIPPVHVLGHCVALGGEIAHRIEDGVISEISNRATDRFFVVDDQNADRVRCAVHSASPSSE